jgi:hypothetical protein
MSPPPICIEKPASQRMTRTTMMSQSKFPMPPSCARALPYRGVAVCVRVEMEGPVTRKVSKSQSRKVSKSRAIAWTLAAALRIRSRRWAPSALVPRPPALGPHPVSWAALAASRSRCASRNVSRGEPVVSVISMFAAKRVTATSSITADRGSIFHAISTICS